MANSGHLYIDNVPSLAKKVDSSVFFDSSVQFISSAFIRIALPSGAVYTTKSKLKAGKKGLM